MEKISIKGFILVLILGSGSTNWPTNAYSQNATYDLAESFSDTLSDENWNEETYYEIEKLRLERWILKNTEKFSDSVLLKEVAHLKKEAEKLLKNLEEINEKLKDIIPKPESSGKSDELQVEIETKIKNINNIMKQSGGNGEEDKCSDEQNKYKEELLKAIKDLNIAIKAAEDLDFIN